MSQASLTSEEPPVEPTPEPEAKSGHVPFTKKVAWSLGAIPDQFITNGVANIALPIYNKGLGLSPVLISVAMAIPRIFDAIIDPTIGNWSDRTKSRWGRRRPFIFVGALLLSFFFVFIWIPPTAILGKNLTLNLPASLPWIGGVSHLPYLFIYFLITSVIAFLGYAIFVIPRGALGIELTTDYHERTKIFAMNSFFAYAITFGLPWLYWLCFPAGRLVERVLGKNLELASKGYGLEIRGIGLVAVVSGAIMLICSLTPLLCKERPPEDESARPHLPVLKAFFMTFQSKPLLIVFFGILLILTACNLVGPMNLYISMDYVCGGNKEFASVVGGWNGTMGGIIGLLMTMVIPAISRRMGKKNAVLMGELIALAGFISLWWLFTPKYPYLQLIGGFLTNLGLSFVWVLSTSMLADVCDLDELKYGLRREGMFGAAYSFLIKVSSSLVLLISGNVLYFVGFQDIPIQTPETIYKLRVWFEVITISCMLGSFFLFWIFPITEKTAREVRSQLDARKKDKTDNAVTN